MVNNSYEETKEVRVEDKIKITRYQVSGKNGYNKLKENYVKGRSTCPKPIVRFNRVG